MTDKVRKTDHTDGALSERIKALRLHLRLEQREMAAQTYTPFRTYQDYEYGNSPPKVSFLQRLVGLGCNPNWLLLGNGPMMMQDVGGREVVFQAIEAASRVVDAHLFGRITDAISKAYNEMGASLPPENLGQLAARAYSDIVEATDDAQERLAMVKLIAAQLRKDLRITAAAPGTGKRLG